MKDKVFTAQEMADFFEQDSKNASPNPMVKERLDYTFMVKSSTYTSKQNSFAGMISWLFSWSNVPAKAALVSLLLFLSVVNFHHTESQFLLPASDTTQNAYPLKVDSAELLPFYADTCLSSEVFNEKGFGNSNSKRQESKNLGCVMEVRKVLFSKKQNDTAYSSRNRKHKLRNKKILT